MYIEIIVFYLLGLIGIGYVTSSIAKALDKKAAANVALWGCIMATGWIIYGGLYVFFSMAPKGG